MSRATRQVQDMHDTADHAAPAAHPAAGPGRCRPTQTRNTSREWRRVAAGVTQATRAKCARSRAASALVSPPSSSLMTRLPRARRTPPPPPGPAGSAVRSALAARHGPAWGHACWGSHSLLFLALLAPGLDCQHKLEVWLCRTSRVPTNQVVSSASIAAYMRRPIRHQQCCQT